MGEDPYRSLSDGRRAYGRGLMTTERIVLLGAGRLATHLSRALKVYAPERRIVQIYSPGGHSARRLAESLGGDVQVASRVDELDRTADCYLFAVPDTAIAEASLRTRWVVMPYGCTSRELHRWRHSHAVIGTLRYSILCRPSPKGASWTSARCPSISRGRPPRQRQLWRRLAVS